jgi:hypothetical protein
MAGARLHHVEMLTHRVDYAGEAITNCDCHFVAVADGDRSSDVRPKRKTLPPQWLPWSRLPRAEKRP